MEKAAQGHRTFRRTTYPALQALFERLDGGQEPPIALVTCADSRVYPELVLGSEPGHLFMIRNAGNAIPPFSSAPEGTVASIQYAVQVLKVKHVVVCGHSGCGAVKAALDPRSARPLDAVWAWIRYVDPGAEPADLDDAVAHNVHTQVANLRTYPWIRDAERSGDLEIHGWVFRIKDATILTHNAKTGAFDQPLGG